MALKKCKECGHQVSTRAKTCPSCGARIRRTSLVSLTLAIFVLVIVLGMVIGGTADAQRATLGDGYACLTEDLYRQFLRAVNERDTNAVRWLGQQGCIKTPAGLPVTVLNRSWTIAHVRAYLDGGETVELWTNRENVRD